MAWETIDRITPVGDPNAGPVLDEAVREKIRSFFPRYETKRAALLPALHVVQDALGHVSYPAMKEIAEVLEIPGVMVYGKTPQEAKAKVQALALRTLADRLENGETESEQLNSLFHTA